eukprot:TRINITY_DN9756_c0_g1_i1.p1 TRINITY_DN9756_c0_g1~~TRINITY_DN9756_c0_g1_i1.p1  ORF type:complete len:406 (-),score=56.71 TRINITY_DN9756_c0_g1_i1:378-1595(-)
MVKSLKHQSIITIELNLESLLPSINKLPIVYIEIILTHLLQRRKEGSRVFRDDMLSYFMVKGLTVLNLETFWVLDEHFKLGDCIDLVEVNLNESLCIGDNAAMELSRCTQLKILKCDWCKNVSDVGLECLSGITTLEHLELKLKLCTDDGLSSVFCSCVNLTDLLLRDGKKITSECLVLMAENLQSLKRLSLADFTCLDDGTFASMGEIGLNQLDVLVISNSPNLMKPRLDLVFQIRLLELRRCRKLYDISALVSCAYLEELHLIYCEYLKDISPLSHIVEQLNVLSLDGCKRLQSDSFAALVPMMYNLMSLSTDRCVKIHETFYQFPDMNLENLHIGWCSLVIPTRNIECESLVSLSLDGLDIKTDYMNVLVEKCPNISYLCLEECHEIRDTSLNCLSTLENLT